MAFIDIAKYLKDKLSDISDKEYRFSNERNLDSPDLEGDVVIRQLSGNPYEESATIPYQFEITTVDPAKVMEDFTQLAIKNNKKAFTEVIQTDTNTYKSYTIIPFFNTPVIMESDLQIGSNHYARIVAFASINVVYQVSNVKKIKIDNEEIPFRSGTLAYTAELTSNKVSGDELNRSKKKTASTALTFLMINKSGFFANKLFQIATGSLPGNTKFSVYVEMDNGLNATMKMIVGTTALSFSDSQLPTNQVNLYLYDERGDSNASS